MYNIFVPFKRTFILIQNKLIQTASAEISNNIFPPENISIWFLMSFSFGPNQLEIFKTFHT